MGADSRHSGRAHAVCATGIAEVWAYRRWPAPTDDCFPKPCHEDFRTVDMVGHSSAVADTMFCRKSVLMRVARKRGKNSPAWWPPCRRPC